jgi:hypothetical protein
MEVQLKRVVLLLVEAQLLVQVVGSVVEVVLLLLE